MTAGDAESRARALVDAASLAAGPYDSRDVLGGLVLVDRALRLLRPLGRPEERAVALDALVARGRMLAALHADDALAAQSEIVERFSDSDAAGAHHCVVAALAAGARLLARGGRDEVGIVWAMRAIRAAGVSDDWRLRSRAEWSVEVLRELVGRATGFEGVALERAVIARLARGRNPGASFEQARLLSGQADGLAESGDLHGALDALDVAERCLEDATAPSARCLLIDVLLARARIIQEAGYHRAALALLEQEIDVRFDEGDASPGGRLADLHVLRGSLLTALGSDEEAILAFAQALDVDPPEGRPWEGRDARQRATRAWGVLQVVERLDLEAALVCHQAGLVGPAHLAHAARGALATGTGGPATRACAALDELSGDAAVEGARAIAAGIRAEHGLDEVVDAESSERARLRLCAAIVAGGDAIALGWAVAATELLPEAEGLSSGFIRALTRSYPGIVTDDEVAAELVSRARRTLRRVGAAVAAQEDFDGSA